MRAEAASAGTSRRAWRRGSCPRQAAAHVRADIVPTLELRRHRRLRLGDRGGHREPPAQAPDLRADRVDRLGRRAHHVEHEFAPRVAALRAPRAQGASHGHPLLRARVPEPGRRGDPMGPGGSRRAPLPAVALRRDRQGAARDVRRALLHAGSGLRQLVQRGGVSCLRTQRHPRSTASPPSSFTRVRFSCSTWPAAIPSSWRRTRSRWRRGSITDRRRFSAPSTRGRPCRRRTRSRGGPGHGRVSCGTACSASSSRSRLTFSTAASPPTF